MNAEDPMEVENGSSRNDEDTPLNYEDKAIISFSLSSWPSNYIYIFYFTLVLAIVGWATERAIKAAWYIWKANQVFGTKYMGARWCKEGASLPGIIFCFHYHISDNLFDLVLFTALASNLSIAINSVVSEHKPNWCIAIHSVGSGYWLTDYIVAFWWECIDTAIWG